MALSAVIWSREAVWELLELWADDEMQEMLDSSYRNKDVYEEIAKKIRKNNPVNGKRFTWLQCRSKIKKLRAEYRKVKTGRENCSMFPYFDVMDKVLKHKPLTYDSSSFKDYQYMNATTEIDTQFVIKEERSLDMSNNDTSPSHQLMNENVQNMTVLITTNKVTYTCNYRASSTICQ